MKWLSCSYKRRPRLTRIAFFGFYGRHNFGDDLFGYVLQHLCNDIPGIEPRLVCASAQRELTHAWTVPVLKRWVYKSGLRGTVARIVTYCAALLCADVAVFGGGTLFGAHASVAFARVISSVGRWVRTPVHAVGVSVGPFYSEPRRIKLLSIVERMASIAVRDRASVRAVSSIPSIQEPGNLGDLAFALPAIYTAKCPDRRASTLIVSIHLPDYIEQVLAILENTDNDRLVERVQFVSLDEESRHTAELIRRRFTPRNVNVECLDYTTSIEEVIDALASAKCVVTSKLHGAITSHVYNVPALLFCYQSKCADFLDDNDLPGPREKYPAPCDCIETVFSLLHHRTVLVPTSDGVQRYTQFKAFLERAAGSGEEV